MAVLTLNGFPVVDGTICLPRIGVWHADLRVDTQTLATGPVTIASEGNALVLRGAIVRGEVWQDAVRARVVGGKAKLGLWCDPKFYRDVPLRIPLTDIANACGETISGRSDRAILGHELETWSRFGGSGYLAVLALVKAADCSWRVEPDGAIWLGRETWPVANVAHVLMEKDPALGCIVIATPVPAAVLPGTLLDGQRVSYVVHRVHGNTVRTEVYVEQQR